MSIWPINRTLLDVTTQGQNGPGSDVNEGVFHIPQSSSITGALLSDCLMSYPGHLLGESHLSAEIHLVYSIALADRAVCHIKYNKHQYIILHDIYIYLEAPVL